ncbi:MAG: TolC family protein, partial [Verrucomicrobiales bacterium]
TLAKLKPLLGLSPETMVTITDPLPSLETISESHSNLEARPDYRAASHLTEAAEREIALERAKRYDDLSVGFFIERARQEDAPNGLERETAVGVRVSFPLPFWNKNEGAIDEKMAKHARLSKERDALAQQVRHETANAQQTMLAQQQLLAEIDTSLGLEMKQQVEALEQAYQQGLTDLQSVLRARRQVVELSAARIDALRGYHRARVQLETALALP